MKNIFKNALLMLAFLFSTLAEAQTLHAFIVSDDTDPKIGAVVDAPHMEAQMQKIAEQAGLTLSLKSFKKSQTSAATMTAAVKNLICTDQDVVFFYYTGHGANAENSNFPLFLLDNTKYSMDWVEEKIKAKNPRLFIALYDACNYTSTPPPPGSGLASRVVNPLAKQANYQKLFKYTSGSIKIASNTKGYKKWSYGDEVDGGIFTRNFTDVLNAAVNGDSQYCTWENIKKAVTSITIERTTNIRMRGTNEIGPTQEPYIILSNVTYMQRAPASIGITPNSIEEIKAARNPD
jgi:hypothetical protein